MAMLGCREESIIGQAEMKYNVSGRKVLALASEYRTIMLFINTAFIDANSNAVTGRICRESRSIPRGISAGEGSEAYSASNPIADGTITSSSVAIMILTGCFMIE